MTDIRTQTQPPGANKVGWRVKQWAHETGISQASTWQLLAEGRIKSVKFGAARIIVTSPEAFLASLEAA